MLTTIKFRFCLPVSLILKEEYGLKLFQAKMLSRTCVWERSNRRMEKVM